MERKLGENVRVEPGRSAEGEVEERDRSMDYFYLPIRDAKKCIGVKVNLFAAISVIGNVKRSRGIDYILTLKIIDQSCPESGIVVNFFAEDPNNLPLVKSIGDIISLHSVEMKIHSNVTCCVYNKKFSSFALFQGKEASDFNYYQVSKRYNNTGHKEVFISKIRIWLLGHPIEVRKNELMPLCKVRTDHAFDSVCKVLHACETSKREWMLFVWDGTDTPPASVQLNLDLEREQPCPLIVEEVPLSLDVICTFPRIGSVLRVSSSRSFEEIQNLHSGGGWVKLHNVVCELHCGMWKATLQPSSEVIILSDEEMIVQQRIKTYADRFMTSVGSYPMDYPSPCHVTVMDYDHLEYSSLIASLSHPEVTHKCMCIVRVVAAYPWQGKDLVSPVMGGYRVRFTLEDPTARIQAYLCGEDGVKFFGGYPSSDVLTSRMNKLLGFTDDAVGLARADAARNPPWFWCCLKSYYINKSDPRGSRKYRIFDTRLVP